MYNLLIVGEHKKAAKLVDDFEMSEKQYVCLSVCPYHCIECCCFSLCVCVYVCLLQVLVAESARARTAGRFDDIEKFAAQKKSPIGYEVLLFPIIDSLAHCVCLYACMYSRLWRCVWVSATRRGAQVHPTRRQSAHAWGLFMDLRYTHCCSMTLIHHHLTDVACVFDLAAVCLLRRPRQRWH